MRNERKKIKVAGELGGGWQENVRFYIHTAIMYNNKLYTYVHEIFLSTTIITFNYNYSWNFFTVMRGREGGRGWRGRKNDRAGSI